jgi:hypothetical protein
MRASWEPTGCALPRHADPGRDFFGGLLLLKTQRPGGCVFVCFPYWAAAAAPAPAPAAQRRERVRGDALPPVGSGERAAGAGAEREGASLTLDLPARIQWHKWALTMQQPKNQPTPRRTELRHGVPSGVSSAMRLGLRLPSIFRRRRSFFWASGWA